MNQTQEPSASESSLLAEYRRLLDLKDEQTAAVSETTRQLEDIELQIRRGLEARGQLVKGAKTGIDGLTLTVAEKWRARYDPELWPSIVAWCGSHDMAHLVQRRLNDKSVMELVDAGKGLPPGLTVEAFLDLGFRRS